MPDSTETYYELRAGAYGGGELHVLSFEGKEVMNGLYTFEVTAWCADLEDSALEAGVNGLPAVLTMRLGEGRARCVRGIVSSVVFEGRREGGRHVVRLAIVPRAFLLHKRVNSRIFQDKTVQQIAEIILDEQGVTRAFNLLAKYPVRQYCVQYQESDYQFLTRIIAEEGIFFFFEQPRFDDDEPERLIFADNVHGYPAIDGDAAIVFRPQHGEGVMHAEENQVQDFRARAHVESSAVTMRDYDFRRPRLDLTSRADLDEAAPLEVYDHHGEYEETDANTESAQVYLEQLRAGAREVHGRSVCRRLLPGHRFTLSDHDAERMNTDHMVTEVEHRGVAPEAAQGSTRVYENRFRCVLADLPYRPARPARQLRQVTESAVVVGPEGQEIFTDSHGRVKVQFHWDREGERNENSSCWMRVAQAWAGAGWGFQFIPRIGMEVLVSFLGGDQDRPVVVGCLYNAANPVPHGLPALAARSGIRSRSTPDSGGWSELAFDDRAGREQLYVRAQRDYDEETGHDRAVRVGRDRREEIGGDSSSTVRGSRLEETVGAEQVTVRGARAAEVFGNESRRVQGSLVEQTTGDAALRVGGARRESIDGPRIIRVEGRSDDHVVGDRVTFTLGGESRIAWADAASTVYGNASFNIAKGLSVAVGSSDAPQTAAAQINGDLKLKTSGALELVVEGEVRIRTGGSSLTIGPEGVKIEAKKITFAAESIEGSSSGSTLNMGDEVEINGKTVKIWSEDKAILQLDKEAKLDGRAVKIKPGLAAEAVEQEKREEQAKTLDKETFQLFDRTGKSIQNAPYELSFFGWFEKGEAADGKVQVPKFPDVETCHLRWGRPKDQRENPKDPEEYEYEGEFYLTTEHADEEEVARRMLNNLGHPGSDLYQAIHSFQSALGIERTGEHADVKDQIVSRHDAAQPVSRNEEA